MRSSFQTLGEETRAVVGLPPPPPGQFDTLVKVARWRAARRPADLAYTFLLDGERQEAPLTYAGLDCRARAIAAELQAHGMQGGRVLLMLEPGLDYNAAVFGCMYAGAVAVPVYPPDPLRAHRTLPRLTAILADAEAGLILTSQEILGLLGDAARGAWSAATLAVEGIPTSRADDWRAIETQPSDLALLQYTSGSTGNPRGVMLTHANLMHNFRSIHRIDSEGVVVVSWLPPYHDLGLIGCVLCPVHSGRHAVLLSPLAFVQRPARWLEAISRYRGKTSASPNFGYELCIRKVSDADCAGLDLSCWTKAINGAEPVRAETMDRFVEKFGPYGFRRATFYPAYGMAESTVFVAGGHRDDAPSVRTFSVQALKNDRVELANGHPGKTRRYVACGKAVPGGRILIVDPASCEPLPWGRVGEIWVRSPSVGLGYWNRPAETEATFAARPAGERNGTFYLRTGDLGFVHEGELFITGRLKEVIILGGRNYYPHDIEQIAQQAHPSLKADGGAAFSMDDGAEERLVIVQEVARPKRVDLAEVIAAIRRELAAEAELSPSAVVLIAAGTIPKTSSGKIRRGDCRRMFLEGQFAALAEWRADQAAAAAPATDPPQGELETRVAALWCEVLGLPAIGRNADFFALGGHSLRAVQLANRIAEEFGVEAPLRTLFAQPTVAALAQLIAAASAGVPAAKPALHAPLAARPANRPPVLSSAEMRLWFFDQLQPRHPFYNMPVAARLRGPLNVAAMEAALQELVRRHETLRTTFPAENGRPVRRIAATGELPIRRVDLRGVPAARRESELARLLREAGQQPFDLAQGPLARCVIFQLGPEEHVVLWALHHIIVDGWSVGVMLREVAAAYAAALGGKATALPPLAIQYSDFAAWQQQLAEGDGLARDYAYWERVLGEPPPPLDLPADRPRPARQSFAGALHPFDFPAELSAQIAALAHAQRTTPFAVLLAAYNVVLSRWCRQDDVAVGTVVAARTRRELEPLVGFLANTLVLRTDCSGGPTFRTLLGRVSDVALEAFAHQEAPFEKVVERVNPDRAASQAPLFQTALVLENAPLDLQVLPGLTMTPLSVDTGTSKYDLALLLSEQGGRLTGQAEYSTALFDEATVARLVGSLQSVLAAAVADPDRPIAQLPLMPEAERQRVLRDHAPPPDPAPEVCLHQLFEAQATAHPDRPAVRCGPTTVSYRDLDRWANRLAHRLQALGVGPEQPVAVCLERSLGQIAAMLAVFKAGGTYVPLDIAQPSDRLAFILQDTAARWLLTEERLAGRLPPGAPAPLFIERLAAPGDTAEPNGKPLRPVAPQQLAYIIYTSGSTGRPKGALLEHRSAANFVRGFVRFLQVNEQDRVLQFFAPCFDGIISDTFSALGAGGCLVIADQATIMAADALQSLLRRERITAATITPSMLRALRPETLPDLRIVCSVGEALAPDLVAQWSGGRRLINGYGLTETAVGACLHALEGPPAHRPPIGRPLPNVPMYVLGPQLEPMPVGVPGEICIGGVQVARGYLNQPELSARSFLADPHAAGPHRRLYRTGDLGRWRPDGTLEFLGRVDYQVKLRGYRIEPDEIAAVLKEHPRVGEAVVVAREDQPGAKRLVAYVAPAKADNGRAGVSAAAAEQIIRWQTVFADTQRRAGPPPDARFNTTGWVDNHTGKPFARAEMREWVDATVERILALRPRRLLEIGCGTGLLLWPVAPHCEQYVATDILPETLADLQQHVAADRALAGRVRLLERRADDFTGLAPRHFDLVVLNSVVQYFPNVAYLLRVLEGVEQLVAPGGHVLLGDLRSLPLHEALCCSIELARAEDSLPRGDLLQRVRRRVAREEELLVAPGLVPELPRRLRRLAAAETLVKRGRRANELTRFRFDAVLHFDRAPEAAAPAWVLDGSAEPPNAEEIVETLIERGGESLRVEGVHNARLAAEVRAWELTQDDAGPATAAAIRAAAQVAMTTAADPEEFCRAAERRGCVAEMHCPIAGPAERFDVTIRRSAVVNAPSASEGPCFFPSPAPQAEPDWSRWVNDPLSAAAPRRLAPQLTAHLRSRLPAHMVPAAVVVLDALPKTPHGKIDRRSLPPPPSERHEAAASVVLPRNEREAAVAAVWEDLLGVSPIGATDNFFELGGHSMLAVQVMAEIERKTGRRLPLASLFQTPTVEHLARLLDDSQTCPPESSLVCLQSEGALRPFFCIHPAGGTVFCYRRLAESLGRQRPFYALQAVGVDGVRMPLQSIEEMAVHYAQTIRAAQRHGPYYLGGWSLGGNLAFETARCLTAQGEQVALLALFDSAALQPDRAPDQRAFLPLVMDFFPDEENLPLETLQAMAWHEQLEYFVQRAGQAEIVMAGADFVAGRHVFEVFRANMQAIIAYRQKSYAGRLLLFAAQHDAALFSAAQQQDFGWGRWAEGGVEVHRVEGNHVRLVLDPHVTALAARLNECLAQADCGAPPYVAE